MKRGNFLLWLLYAALFNVNKTPDPVNWEYTIFVGQSDAGL